MKVIIRILCAPFLLCIYMIWITYVAIKNTGLFIRHGGEWITYSDELQKATMKKIFDELAKQNETK